MRYPAAYTSTLAATLFACVSVDPGLVAAPTLPAELRPDREPAEIHASIGSTHAATKSELDEPVRTTSLAEVVGQAWESSTDVLVAEARLEQARASTLEANGELAPELRLDAGGAYLGGREVSNFGETQDVEFARFELGAELIYQLNLASRIALASEARLDQEAVSLDTREAKRRAARSAALAYHDVSLSHAAVLVADDLVADAEVFLGIAEARARAEIASEADVSLAQAELAGARRMRIDAEAQWKTTSATLAALLRWDPRVLLVPEERDIRPVARLDTRDPGALHVEALESRPDLEAARRRIEAAKRKRTAVGLDILAPDLSIRVRERALATDSRGFGDTTMVQGLVGWQFSIADVGRARRARAELRERELVLAGTEERIEAEIQGAVGRIDSLELALDEAETALDAATRAHEIQLARFESGTGLGIEVIQAERSVARARLDLIDTILRFNAEQIDLLATIGHLDPVMVDTN